MLSTCTTHFYVARLCVVLLFPPRLPPPTPAASFVPPSSPAPSAAPSSAPRSSARVTVLVSTALLSPALLRVTLLRPRAALRLCRPLFPLALLCPRPPPPSHRPLMSPASASADFAWPFMRPSFVLPSARAALRRPPIPPSSSPAPAVSFEPPTSASPSSAFAPLTSASLAFASPASASPAFTSPTSPSSSPLSRPSASSSTLLHITRLYVCLRVVAGRAIDTGAILAQARAHNGDQDSASDPDDDNEDDGEPISGWENSDGEDDGNTPDPVAKAGTNVQTTKRKASEESQTETKKAKITNKTPVHRPVSSPAPKTPTASKGKNFKGAIEFDNLATAEEKTHQGELNLAVEKLRFETEKARIKGELKILEKKNNFQLWAMHLQARTQITIAQIQANSSHVSNNTPMVNDFTAAGMFPTNNPFMSNNFSADPLQLLQELLSPGTLPVNCTEAKKIQVTRATMADFEEYCAVRATRPPAHGDLNWRTALPDRAQDREEDQRVWSDWRMSLSVWQEEEEDYSHLAVCLGPGHLGLNIGGRALTMHSNVIDESAPNAYWPHSFPDAYVVQHTGSARSLSDRRVEMGLDHTVAMPWCAKHNLTAFNVRTHELRDVESFTTRCSAHCARHVLAT
ncbi:uncharacterized protein BXZ73DRAFT_106843 [Epithele typhae]|uniref:uncharacterized protein n=1 Tax=Epithele typhae TaxID=378194 RepID=UPI00200817EA|nr:uncharacterized protein BXZ73DRAFT_106843 [Epithele typhae]KAH9913823.1 hypothetical protein BXZ73DRAFT_106843 [Epithele typhae]